MAALESRLYIHSSYYFDQVSKLGLQQEDQQLCQNGCNSSCCQVSWAVTFLILYLKLQLEAIVRGQSGGRAHDAGVADQDIQALACAVEPLGKCLDIFQVAQVQLGKLHRARLAPGQGGCQSQFLT